MSGTDGVSSRTCNPAHYRAVLSLHHCAGGSACASPTSVPNRAEDSGGAHPRLSPRLSGDARDVTAERGCAGRSRYWSPWWWPPHPCSARASRQPVTKAPRTLTLSQGQASRGTERERGPIKVTEQPGDPPPGGCGSGTRDLLTGRHCIFVFPSKPMLKP